MPRRFIKTSKIEEGIPHHILEWAARRSKSFTVAEVVSRLGYEKRAVELAVDRLLQRKDLIEITKGSLKP